MENTMSNSEQINIFVLDFYEKQKTMSNPANPPPYPGPAPAPQPGIQVVHVQPVPTQYVTTAPVLVGRPVGSDPALVVCPSCRHQIVTNTLVRPSLKTHLWALGLCLIGFWPCIFIPYCSPACMNVDHYCPNCNAYIGKYD
ncbi:hypothetical protein PYW08_015274 [Mythimna loreyi]|uniref:Uncharacterized protein n=1 Tax=Mythimna loreyi TaxID=667449 RepID=A0ACC2QVH4_9NEOP|nr:hypothetical protein PYW08_015274 [Mythimna loreyi]